jgi:hypothetical protein
VQLPTQGLLRCANVSTTLGLYAQSVNSSMVEAQESMLKAILRNDSKAGKLSSRRPDVRTRMARILPDDWAIAASRTRLWLLSEWDLGVGVFLDRVGVQLQLLPVCRK